MSKATKFFSGQEGFYWYVGVVEDRQDPEKMGRVRVRCFGWHTDDKKKISTESLPWAHPITPVNSPAAYSPKEGDMVFGFFMDGHAAQNPVVIGVFPGKPDKKPNYQNGFSDPGKDLSKRPKKPSDSAEQYPKSKYLKEPTTSRLSRENPDGTIVATRKKNLKKNVKSAGGISWSEPNPAYAAKYPYNNVIETESGHAFELDDTPNAERVSLSHRNGSFIEIDSNGNRIDRVQKDNYSVIMGDDFIYVKGKAVITVDGNFNLKTSTVNIEAAAINMAADGAIRIKGSSVNIEATGAMNLKAGGVGNFTSGGKLSLKGSSAALAGSSVDFPAGKIGMQTGSAATASGAGITGGGTTPTTDEKQEVSNATAASAVSSAGANSVATTASANGTVSSTNVSTATSTTANASTKGVTIGKTVDGVTSTVSNAYSEINKSLDNTIKDFASNAPVGELSSKVSNLEDQINSSKGQILSLNATQKNEILSKIDRVDTLSANSNIDFNPDSGIVAEIDKVKNQGVPQVSTVLAKQIYPQTVSVQVVSTSNTGNV